MKKVRTIRLRPFFQGGNSVAAQVAEQASDSTHGKLHQGLKNMINRYVQYHKARVDDIQIIPLRDISFGLYRF
jgi:hypothetical protein